MLYFNMKSETKPRLGFKDGQEIGFLTAAPLAPARFRKTGSSLATPQSLPSIVSISDGRTMTSQAFGAEIAQSFVAVVTGRKAELEAGVCARCRLVSFPSISSALP
jgi:hypothetical protein